MFSSATSATQTGLADARALDDELDLADEAGAELDEGYSSEWKETHSKLMEWLNHERDRQAENRYQMALDGEYYDGNQWLEEDARKVEERGQAPLVFNEVAVSLNWIIGSEKRNRVDWRVLPRTEDDTQSAEIKTKVMKYVSDVNNVSFVRSAVFAEAAISGLSWIEDSISDDATSDILYCGHQSWRTAYHDSYHKRLDGRDMRYFIRWKDTDLDIAQAMWPEKREELRRASQGAEFLTADDSDSLWYLGQPLQDKNNSQYGRRTFLASTSMTPGRERDRVRVYEGWYRMPERAQVIRGGALDGELYDESMPAHAEAINGGEAVIQPSIIMRVKCAFFTEECILEMGDSPFKHNDIPFTPLYAFRRQRDGLPYGFIRNQRDPQDDLNKRMSKSLFILSVNQLITEKDAFSDEEGEYSLQDAIDNASNPQGVFILKDGTKKFEIRRDYAEEQQQMLHVSMDRQFLQSASGVTDELIGRKTNATSGRAIEARQDQGSLATSGIFDNHRFMIRLSGQKQLSNAEKFYAMPKVVRISGDKGKTDWVRINQPEVDPVTGEVRFINDITATKADFIVDEQDYRASMRMAMFDSLNEMIGKVGQYAPQFAIGLLDLLVDLADFPGKEAMVERLKTLIAEARGETKTPEQAAAEVEGQELQKQGLAAKVAKDQAAANKADAEADQIRMTIPATAVAMDLQNVAQAAAIARPGQVMQPMQPEQAAPSGQPDMGMPPASPAPIAQPGVLAPDGTAAPSLPMAQGTPDPNGALIMALANIAEKLTSGMNTLAATVDSVAASVEQVASTVERIEGGDSGDTGKGKPGDAKEGAAEGEQDD